MKQHHMKRWLSLVMFLLYAAGAHAITLTPTYTYTVGDAVTGSNFISGEGWYVTPNADEHDNDLIRERPLGNQDFSSAGGQWVHPGQYYSYLDIVNGQWGYDSQYLYFKQTLYGNWFMSDAGSDRDYGAFGSGTLYNIIIGQDVDQEANGSILLRVSGDTKETWAGPSGEYEAKATQGWLDANGDVGDSGITVTKEEGDSAGNGYDREVIKSDGYLDTGSKPEVLFARITGAELEDDSMPYVEIAFDYLTWNFYATALSLPLIDITDISLLVFEANRGIKDNANYLWNDRYPASQEGSPYHIADENGVFMTQLGNVYELDRVFWHYTENGNGGGEGEPIPEPSTFVLLGAGLAGLAAMGIRPRKN